MPSHIDETLHEILQQETVRQEKTISLIASENYVSSAIQRVTASVLTNKYAEGYPGKRYYAGCEFVDQVEQLAIDRCKQLFNASHANVQPHSGSQANFAVYSALIKPGDTILGMSLQAGGHLTHGHSVNVSGSWFKSVQYGVSKDTELIDYDEVEQLAKLHRPAMIIAGASAYSRIIDFEKFAAIAQSVGALLIADIAHIAGLIAAQLHPTPIGIADIITSTTHKTLRGPRGGLIMAHEKHAASIDRAIIPGTQGGPLMHVIAAKAVAFYEALQPSFVEYQKQVIANAQAMAHTFNQLGYRIVAGGTDNHLFIIDLRSANITGLLAQESLEKAGITVSRSCIPFDPEKPWITSGIRIGTPAITTRGMKEKECVELAELIDSILLAPTSTTVISTALRRVRQLCDIHPTPTYSKNIIDTYFKDNLQIDAL